MERAWQTPVGFRFQLRPIGTPNGPLQMGRKRPAGQSDRPPGRVIEFTEYPWVTHQPKRTLMTYAPGDRAYYDADSHIMELPDFLTSYTDPEFRDQIPLVNYSASLVTDEEVAEIVGNGNRHSDAHVAKMRAMGDTLIRDVKEIQALGAFHSADRSEAMDMLGFARQLVFATHSVVLPFHPSSKTDPRLRYGATRAHNRHMKDFCANDERLMGVAVIPLDDPNLAIAELDNVLQGGFDAVWVPHRSCGDKSPGHVELEPFWARLAESQTPFLLHVGGAPLQLSKAWTNTGRTPVKDWMGGGENVRSKDAATMHQGPETFLSALIMDGVLERHDKLRGAVVELGAGWVPELLRRLDMVAGTYARVDPTLKAFTRKPSEQIGEQLAFTPFVFEDVGRLVTESNEDLYLFSSDYPHTEGGRDPIARFESTLATSTAAAKDKFYADNFLRIFPDAA